MTTGDFRDTSADLAERGTQRTPLSEYLHATAPVLEAACATRLLSVARWQASDVLDVLYRAGYVLTKREG